MNQVVLQSDATNSVKGSVCHCDSMSLSTRGHHAMQNAIILMT